MKMACLNPQVLAAVSWAGMTFPSAFAKLTLCKGKRVGFGVSQATEKEHHRKEVVAEWYVVENILKKNKNQLDLFGRHFFLYWDTLLAKISHCNALSYNELALVIDNQP